MQGTPGQSQMDLLARYWNLVWEHLDGPTYIDSALDPETATVRVWYAEAMPSPLRPVVADALTVGVRIEFVRTRFNHHEITAACRVLSDALGEAEVDVRSIGLGTPSGGPAAGLTVGVPEPHPALQARIEEVAARVVPDVPVVVVKDDRRPYSVKAIDR